MDNPAKVAVRPVKKIKPMPKHEARTRDKKLKRTHRRRLKK